MAKDSPETISVAGLARELTEREKHKDHRPIAFLLGAGASIESGVPGAGKMVLDWIGRMHEECPDNGINPDPLVWFAESNHVEGFDPSDPAGSYSAVYDLRFKNGTDPAGYRYLEHAIDGKSPSVGYYILAMLAQSQARLILTTNFDNLLADALVAVSPETPMVCTHESLAGYVTDRATRPSIIKIHRDLLLNPHSTQATTGQLSLGMSDLVKRVCESHTLVVIGYGGNDGSLMQVLESLGESRDARMMFWCYYESKPNAPSARPPERILNIVRQRKGCLVPHSGFDRLMVEIGHPMGFGQESLEGKIKERTDERLTNLTAGFEKFKRALADASSPPTVEVIEAASTFFGGKDSPSNWWEWQVAINAETDSARQGEMYEEALSAIPNSHQLMGNYANFLTVVRGEHEQAEAFYKLAIEADPEDAIYLGNYAVFLTEDRGEHGQAEAMYKRATEADPKNAYNMGNYSKLLIETERVPQGLELLDRAIDLRLGQPVNPMDAELAMYSILFGPANEHKANLKKLKRLIEVEKIRTGSWNFGRLIGRALSGGHPYGDWLNRLADVLAERATPDTLDEWTEWKNAG